MERLLKIIEQKKQEKEMLVLKIQGMILGYVELINEIKKLIEADKSAEKLSTPRPPTILSEEAKFTLAKERNHRRESKKNRPTRKERNFVQEE